MANWSWIIKQANNIRTVIFNPKVNKAEAGLKMISNGRNTEMDLKLAKNGGITKVLDDFRVTNIGKSIKTIITEYNHTIIKHAPFHSTYEGWALIKQKVDELWEEVKKEESGDSKEAMLKEAAQIGAMAMRFIIDLGIDDKPVKVSTISEDKKSNFENFL
jgi:tetrahydromethanopterin S-methyltransferase subunit H